MRFWLAEKKQILMERTENKRKQREQESTCEIDTQDDETIVSDKIAEIVFKIVEKAEFLIKLKTPEVFERGKENDISALPHLVKQSTHMSIQEPSAQETDLHAKVKQWKQEIEEQGHSKSEVKES